MRGLAELSTVALLVLVASAFTAAFYLAAKHYVEKPAVRSGELYIAGPPRCRVENDVVTIFVPLHNPSYDTMFVGEIGIVYGGSLYSNYTLQMLVKPGMSAVAYAEVPLPSSSLPERLPVVVSYQDSDTAGYPRAVLAECRVEEG